MTKVFMLVSALLFSAIYLNAQNITQGYQGQGHSLPSQTPAMQFYGGFVVSDATNYPASHGSLFGYTNSNNGYGYSYQIFKGHTVPVLKIRFSNFAAGNTWFPWRMLFDSGSDLNYEGDNVDSKISGYAHIHGRPGDGVLHLHGGTSNGQVFINNDETGNIILARGGGNVSIGSSLNPTHMLTLSRSGTYANIRLQRTGVNPADFSIASGYGQLEFRNSGDEVKMTLEDNGHLGIGTANATHVLTIEKSDSYANIRLKRTQSNTADFGIWSGYGQLEFRNSTDAIKFVLKDNGNVGIGTTEPDERLTVKGSIHTHEVRVDTEPEVVPDYVFEPDYDLVTLAEVEAYIKENKHLPEVPSAKEMGEKGMNLKEMNLLLLKKVEELTLHLIELKKENVVQKDLLDKQQAQINEILKDR